MPYSFNYSFSFFPAELPADCFRKLVDQRPDVGEMCLRSKPVDNVVLLMDSIMNNLQALEDSLDEDAGLITIIQINPHYKQLLSFLPEDAYISEDDADEYGLSAVEWEKKELLRVWVFTPESLEYDYEKENHLAPDPDRAVGFLRSFVADSATSLRTLH